MKCKVIIVDDHRIFRDGFKLALEAVKNAYLVGEASNGEEMLAVFKKVTPDLVFVDVNMPVMNGYEAVVQALAKYPLVKFIALTSFGDIDSVKKMIHAGVEGYMLKNSEIEEIEKAISHVMNGKNYFSDEVLFHLTKSAMHNVKREQSPLVSNDLSNREQEVLNLLCQGKSAAEIAEELFISERTVEKHKENLMIKSQTKNAVNLILWAFKNHIVELSI